MEFLLARVSTKLCLENAISAALITRLVATSFDI